MKLNKREKYYICSAAGFICLFVLIQFVFFPVLDQRERNKRMLQAKTKTLKEIVGLKTEYDSITKRVELSNVRFKKRKKGFTLFSFLDELAGKAGIKGHITYMKPSKVEQKDSPYTISQVEMKLQALTLKQVTDYLYMVETSRNIVLVKRISISKAGKQKEFIDAVLQVETFNFR